MLAFEAKSNSNHAQFESKKEACLGESEKAMASRQKFYKHRFEIFSKSLSDDSEVFDASEKRPELVTRGDQVGLDPMENKGKVFFFKRSLCKDF